MVSQLVNRTGTGSVWVTPSAEFSVLQRDVHLRSAEPYTCLLYASPLDEVLGMPSEQDRHGLNFTQISLSGGD